MGLLTDPGANLSIFVLPALAVGIGLSASLMRITRSALLDVLTMGYVTTARAKGLAPSTVLWRHAIKNAMIPIVTVLGLQMGYLLGGVVIVETVFNLPGLGRFTVDAISSRDYPVVQATVLLVTVIVLFINLFVDILYAFLDPRIKYGQIVMRQATRLVPGERVPRTNLRITDFSRRFMRSPAGVVGLGGPRLVILLAILAPIVAPDSPYTMNRIDSLQGPSRQPSHGH